MDIPLRLSKRRPVYPMPASPTDEQLLDLSTRHDTVQIVQSASILFETDQEMSLSSKVI